MAKHFTAEEQPASFITHWLQDGIGVMKKFKPGDRSQKDRRWAIAITEAEKLLAYWHTWVDRETSLDGEEVTTRVLSPKPNDIIVLSVQNEISDKARDEIVTQAKVLFPDNKVVVMMDGIDVSMMSAELAANAILAKAPPAPKDISAVSGEMSDDEHRNNDET